MTTTIQFSPSQHAILAYAAHHTEGRIEWFPDNVKGGVRQKVLGALQKQEWITGAEGAWVMTPAGYAALNLTAANSVAAEAAPLAEPLLLQAVPEEEPAPAPVRPHTRANSKQAEVLALLQRPEGATIPQICAATQWQAHTVRGTFAGAFKKKLGYTITSSKEAGGERVYRIS